MNKKSIISGLLAIFLLLFNSVPLYAHESASGDTCLTDSSSPAGLKVNDLAPPDSTSADSSDENKKDISDKTNMDSKDSKSTLSQVKDFALEHPYCTLGGAAVLGTVIFCVVDYFLDEHPKIGMMELFNAAKNGDVTAFEQMSNDEIVNFLKSVEGYIILYRAVQYNRYNIVDQFRYAFLKCSQEDEWKKCLFRAMWLFVSSKTRSQEYFGASCLSDTETLEYFRELCCVENSNDYTNNINKVDERGYTILDYACMSKRDKCAKFLINNGAKECALLRPGYKGYGFSGYTDVKSNLRFLYDCGYFKIEGRAYDVLKQLLGGDENSAKVIKYLLNHCNIAQYLTNEERKDLLDNYQKCVSEEVLSLTDFDFFREFHVATSSVDAQKHKKEFGEAFDTPFFRQYWRSTPFDEKNGGRK